MPAYGSDGVIITIFLALFDFKGFGLPFKTGGLQDLETFNRSSRIDYRRQQWKRRYVFFTCSRPGRQSHISYIDNSNGVLKYAFWDGSSWDITSLDDAYHSTSLALDSNGWPHISYYDIGNGALKYGYWNGSSWNTTTVDPGGIVGRYNSLALDSNGRPHISYYDSSNENLKYAHFSDSGWDTTTVVSSSDDVGRYTSIVVDQYENPHITYTSYNLNNVYYAHYNQLPEASFSYSPLKPGPDDTVTFDASEAYDPDGSIGTYKWDWDGDGAFEDTLSSPTVDHTFSDAGDYPVTLKVIEDDGSSNTSTKTVSVQSNQVVLTLDGVSVTECGVSWTESGRSSVSWKLPTMIA